MNAGKVISIFILVTLSVATVSSATIVGPITFASDSDYDNASPQASGVFRDFLNGSAISRGNDLGGTGYTALNYTTGAAITVYDTTPSSDTVKNLFTGSLTLSADVLAHNFNNTRSPGLLALFNEGAGSYGVTYRVSDAGGTDPFYISKVAQNGTMTNLASTANSGWTSDIWYHMVMDIIISGSNITITGKTYTHQTSTNPNSAVTTTQLGSTVTYTSTLSAIGLDLTGIGEVGFALSGSNTGSSITNFQVVQIPEPATIAMLGLGALSLLRKRKA